MKIIINGRFLLHRITGVERYAREIIEELDKVIKPDELEIAIPPETKDIPDYNNIRIVKVGNLHNRLWEHISFPCYVKKQKGISLNLCNVGPLPAPGMVCIMDTKIKAHPEFYERNFLIWYKLLYMNSMKRAKKIITISEFSKREICKYYKVDPEKIIVIPCAWQHMNRIEYDEAALDKYGLLKEEYYFSMCSLEPNKNFKWIAEAAKSNPYQVFAIAGSINKKVFADGLGFECPENMKLLGYVSDEEAKSLMRDCKAFLFPSFYEGFGIPPLEAISAGCKNVVVSDTELMHEIFGDGVCYIDPNDYINMEKIQQVNTRYTDLLSKYSWKASAEKMYDMLRKISK